jgi:hypothetical protein
MKSSILSNDDTINMYSYRCDTRQLTLLTATMNFVQYFIDLGDDQATANAKVSELSTEVAVYLYAYVLGNKQPLIDGVNNSTLPFMDQTAKDSLINDLV